MTQTQRLVDNLLRERFSTTLPDYLAAQRTAGQSYEKIAKDLHVRSGGLVAVTWQTINRWCASLEVAA